MALDPGLLKRTGNDYVYVAYTYDADADPATQTDPTNQALICRGRLHLHHGDTECTEKIPKLTTKDTREYKGKYEWSNE